MAIDFPDNPSVGQQTPDGRWRWTGNRWEANVDRFRLPPAGPAGNIAISDGVGGWNSWAPAAAGLSIPPGAIIFFAGLGFPTGWLPTNGAQISRTTYNQLFATIGTYYGAGDGFSTFNLPDCRGKFLRSYHDGVGQNPGQLYGGTEGDTTRSHTHAGINGTYFVAFGPFPIFTTTSVAIGGVETRPINITFRALIKF